MTDTSLAPTASGRRRGRSARAPSASGTRRAVRGSGTGRGAREEWLTVDEVCAELRIGRRTFERWRTLGVAPRATRPTRNGPLKIKRSWLEEWAEDGAT
jgi:hypothetical protein